MMTEEEERDFETFALASPNIPKWKEIMEGLSRDYKILFSGPAGSCTSQARPVVPQALAWDQVDQVQGQAQP